MTPLRNFIFTTLLIGLLACNSKNNPVEKEKQAASKPQIKSLTGQAYFFAPELDTSTCEVSGACDCCSSNILFIDNRNFITIGYCEADEQILRGTYQIDNDKVYLQYDTLEVDKEYNWEMETDSSGTVKTVKTEYFIKTQKTEANKVTLTALTCKGQMCFKIVDETVWYGTLDKKTTLNQHLQWLKDQGIWDKIK